MKTTTFVAGGAVALVVFWTVLAFVRFQMILTIAYGFAGTSGSNRLVADARWSFLCGCLGACVLLGVTLAGVVHRVSSTKKKAPGPVRYHPPIGAGLPSV